MAARPFDLTLARNALLLLISVMVWVLGASACERSPTHGKPKPPDAANALTIACPSGTTSAGGGPPAASSAWCVDDHGLQHGPAVEWFDDGAKRSVGEYEHGRLAGTWRSYYSSGTLRSEKSYARGKPSGTWTTFFADGSRSTVLVHGTGDAARITEYGPSGAKLREGGLVAGARHGAWVEWDANGNEIRSEWDKGKPKAGAVAALIGVPECDEYIAKYSRCIEDKIPEAARQQMREAMLASVSAFREAAQGPAREGLATACKAALDAAMQATASMGCQW